MNPDTTPTPRTDSERNKAFCNLRTDYEAYAYMANHAETLERELAEKTNEVAKLREVCEWAADMMDGISPTRGQEIRDSLARLAPLPEEPETSAHTDKCIGNVTEPANPTCSNTTHKHSYCDCKEPIPEWRELGPDELIHTGDQVQAKHHDKVHGVWFEVFPYEIGAMPIDHEAFRYRTRRPLPVQEEMPLEGDIEDLEEIANSESLPSSVAAIAAKTTYAIRYLRDEIQKLKQK